MTILSDRHALLLNLAILIVFFYLGRIMRG